MTRLIPILLPALLVAACNAIPPVEYVAVTPEVRALHRPGEPEPFRYEMQVRNSPLWYEAVPVGNNRFVLTNQGRQRWLQDEIYDDDRIWMFR